MRKKLFSILTCCVLALSVCGCAKDAEKEYFKDVAYKPEHTSKTRFVNFASSDKGLDAFLNEYTERHMRDTGKAIGSQKVGQATRTAWREWDTMIGSWWDASAENGAMSTAAATNDQVNKWLEEIRIDRQGYVWCDNEPGIGSWGLGWAFPSHDKGGTAWTFDSYDDYEDFTLANAGKFDVEVSNSCLYVTPREPMEKIELEFTLGMSNNVSPLFRIGFGWENASQIAGGEVDDLYVSYTTAKDPNYSDSQKAAFSDFCLNGYEIGDGDVVQENFYFPMYLQPEWGNFYNYETEKTQLTQIDKMKITLAAKSGDALSGTLSLDFIATQFDDRQIINPCNYIIAAKNNVEFTRDKELISKFLPRARACMNFLLSCCDGDSGLISTEYLVGHFNNNKHARYTGIGNGYWDVDAFPNVNLYCNTSYYNALTSMAYLENLARELEVDEYSRSVTCVGKDMHTAVTYTEETAAKIPALAQKCKERIQKEFWNEATGRFHAGVYDRKAGGVQDHGYTMFNQQCITSGIATAEQTAKIMSWINGERTVKGDDSTGADIYRYEIAPRFNTHNIGNDFMWAYGVSFDGNVQNGGTALHLSYYDVVSESYVSANSAFGKLKKLQSWYEKVKAAGGEGMRFYREYYDKTDIKLQGNGNGLVGVDVEFLEAALLFASVPDAFFGLDTLYDGTLCVTPNMPDGLEWQRIENLVYDGHYYDLTAGKNFVQLSATADYRQGAAGKNTKVRVAINKPSGEYKVLVDGKQTADYKEENGKVTVTVPFGNVKVQVLLAK